MKNIKNILAFVISAAMLSGCTAEITEAEVTETTSETSATTQNEYILTRGWDGKELLDSIFYCGGYHPLPMSIEDNPDFTLSDKVLYFPDGSSAKTTADENGTITALNFSASTAPADFSVYGVGFDTHPSDIPVKLGFANTIVGSEETQMTFEFTGGGITRLYLEFKEGKLVTVYIHS